MSDYQTEFAEEIAYLEKTLSFIKQEIDQETAMVQERKETLLAARKDMMDNTVNFSDDFEKLADWNQYNNEVNNQTAYYMSAVKRLDNFRKMVDTPYFGRFDFAEAERPGLEKIYVGLHNVIDPGTNKIYIYDWRAPIASIFYRYEPGPAVFQAPGGLISGEVFLKRQYKILKSMLKYYFDCSLKIDDEMLQEVLSRNASAKMRSIVETIQKEQDMIIRDTAHELLIVQGAAGSGKTSVALHRIAFLLYEGLQSRASANDFLIISPNAVFGKYISSVLPELGEENVAQTTFDRLLDFLVADDIVCETRNEQLESLIEGQNMPAGEQRLAAIQFKGSKEFTMILDRLMNYYERQLIPFEDIYYDDILVESKENIRTLFLKNRATMPMASRLEKIKNRIWEKIRPVRQNRLKKIEKEVQQSEGHDLEIKSYSRLRSINETKVLAERLKNFTQVDYRQIYRALFDNLKLIRQLAKEITLPADIEAIIIATKERLAEGSYFFEDGVALLYLKLRTQGLDPFYQVRQVVIDEAQDYYPLQYEIFSSLFKGARYTVLGDLAQSLEKQTDQSIYEDIPKIFRVADYLKMNLDKSYRSSYEIGRFARQLLGGRDDYESFERHENEPRVSSKSSHDELDSAVLRDIENFQAAGYESIAVICKTGREAEAVYHRLQSKTAMKLLNRSEGEIHQGVLVLPTYMAKGLEFDVVVVYDAGSKNYRSEFDRRLLYVACTRALHQLVLYYIDGKSHFLPENSSL